MALGKYCETEAKYNKTPQAGQIIVVEYCINGNQECVLSIFVEENDNSRCLIYTIKLPKREEIMNWYPIFSKPNNATKIKLIPHQDSNDLY